MREHHFDEPRKCPGAPVQSGQFNEIFVVAGDGPEDIQVFR